jgi:S1/P1 Nuclease
MNLRLIVTLLLVSNGLSRDCWAWGDQGHKVICEIAFRLVQPNTRAEIQKVIGTDERFSSFSDSCTWPDHPRQRASEHFLNLPRDSDGLHAETCGGRVGLRRDGDQEGLRRPVV